MTNLDKITVPKIIGKKQKSEKIVCLTAYDWLLARLLDQAGVDVILVGDSAGMVFHGYKTTLPVTLDQMLDHTRAVARGVSRALIVSDMPFLSYQASTEQAIQNAGLFLKEGNAEAVKLEGGEPIAETIHRLVSVGIPVMGHLGLTPQSIQKFGGYRIRGKSSSESEELIKDARILEEAGVFAIVLEKAPADLAKKITESISIPTIGIGAGPHCDGQILVTQDILGMFEDFRPKFVRRYANLAETIRDAVTAFADDVRSNQYPSKDESF
ncbi:3-methyl-2-oxobutanoate hydroxymethyltransferase [candidate division KSB1 bacterium]|nr:3-methyl-2-oxobutanoate hydroxymethyltransferase [candidate division KSB1 bacterium]